MRKRSVRTESLLDRSILLDEREGPPLVRGALVFGSALVMLFVIWSAFMGLEEIELAPGEIVTSEAPVKIQHPSGGIIVDLPVREGSRVAAGELLLRLDPGDTDAQRQQWTSQLLSLRAQRERLLALSLGRDPDFSFLPAEASRFVADQLAIFQSGRAKAKLSLSILDGQIEQSRASLEGFADRSASLGRQIELADEDAIITMDLVERRMAAKSELLAKRRGLEALKEESASLANQSELARLKLAEVMARKSEYLAEEGKQFNAELASVDDRIAQAEAGLGRLSGPSGRLELRAPTAGLVHALAFSAAGMVVQPGAVVMELIPVGKALKAQVRIDPRSIGSVSPGQEARLKLSAYPYDRYGAFKGRLAEISPSTFPSGDGRSYYRGIVDIEGRELEAASPLALLPGMTLSAELRTGKKNLLQYLLKPIFASAREAFREK